MSNTSQRMLQQGQADQRPPWRKLPKIFRTNWSFVTPQPRLMVHSEKTDIQLSDSRKPLMKVMFYIQSVQKLCFFEAAIDGDYLNVIKYWWPITISSLKMTCSPTWHCCNEAWRSSFFKVFWSKIHLCLCLWSISSKNLWSFEDFRPKIPKIFRKKAPFVEEILKEN